MKITPVKKIATVLGAGSLLLGAVAAAPAASAASPAATPAATAPAPGGPTAGTRTSLVAAWYQQFLGRSAATDAGSQYWIARLRTDPYDQVLAEFLRSPEYVTGQVTAYYRTYLGRGLDSGASYWTTGVENGAFPLEWVEQNVLGSTEFVVRSVPAGSDAYQTVQDWYAAVLGRQARPGEVDYWATRLETASPLQVVREIWYTPEGVNHRTAVHYSTLLGRSANPGELSYWFNTEVSGDISVTISIATSDEYRENALTKG